MENLTIKAQPRSLRGKKNKALRRQGRIPAVIYGAGKNLSFSLDLRAAEKFCQKRYENKIFTFSSEDKALDGLKAIKKSADFHALKRVPIHMDFLCLDMDKPVKVQVEIRFKGKPKGALEGGVFSVSLRSLEMECKPGHIPAFVELDVSGLEKEQNLHVKDIPLPSNVKLLTPLSRALCAVSEAKEEAAPAAAGDQAASAQSAPGAEKSAPAAGPAKGGKKA